MKPEEYKEAKKTLGFQRDLTGWLDLIAIKHDTHRSYSCGRMEISERVETIINLHIALHEEQEKNHLLKKENERLTEKIAEMER